MNFTQLFLTLLSAAPAYSAPVSDNSVTVPNSASTEHAVQPPSDVYLVARDSTAASSDEILTLLRSFDTQIDNVLSLVGPALSSTTGGVSQEVGTALLSPFVKSLTDKLNQLIAPQISSGLKSLNSDDINNFVNSLVKLTDFASRFQVDTSGLQSFISKIKGALS